MGDDLEGVICLTEGSDESVSLSDEVLKAIEGLRKGKSELFDESFSDSAEPSFDAYTESTSYSISVSYDGSSHNYYEQASESSGNGAYFSYSDQEFLEEAQAVASECRSADDSNRVSVSVEVDCYKKDLKEAVKVRSVSLWQTMYDGKLFFSG